MKQKLLPALATMAAGLAFAGASQATPAPTLVATIYGEYDTNGIGDLPSSVTSGLTWVNNSGDYDTPALFFVNTTGEAITGVQLQLSGFGEGTYNNGKTQTVTLGTLDPGSVTELAWSGGCSPGMLFCNDYDDEYSSNYGANPHGAPTVPKYSTGSPTGPGGTPTDCTLNVSGNNPEWFNFCAPTGNFNVVMTGKWNGQSVYSLFGEVNIAGSYVGWEGVDPYGWSENADFDVHSGQVSGVLANIYLGTVPTTPEPSALALMAAGLLGLGMAMRRRMSSKSR